MTIHERVVSDVVLIQISGRVTLTDGTAVFDHALRRLVDGGRVKLILDLEGVPYIDSTALGIILRAHATVTRRGGALRLLHVGSSIRHILELTRLSTVIDVFDSEQEAIASLAVPPPGISRTL